MCKENNCQSNKHELKTCSRCRQDFECKTGDIANCQCNGIALSPDTAAFIESRYQDCICRTCLLSLNNKQVLFKEKFLTPPTQP